MVGWSPRWGVLASATGTEFQVWSPNAKRVLVVDWAGRNEVCALTDSGSGIFRGRTAENLAGLEYGYLLDDSGPFPDPVSRFQPKGVHGPSQVVEPDFHWSRPQWRGNAELVVYELHLGTFSEQGTYLGAIGKLDHLADLGVTAIELMPVADFPGRWNWGYDGVCLFAPARCYGSPADLRRLIDSCHQRGIAVLLDVVYNHLGPDGNYLANFSERYFTSKHWTPWGPAVNFDDDGCEIVRQIIVENALYWIHEFQFDGLRLDATHAIKDDSNHHIVAEISEAVDRSAGQRIVHVIAEDHGNLGHMVRTRQAGGWGLRGVWADDFHHHVRRHVTGDRDGYYQDYQDNTDHLAQTLRHGWFFRGQHSDYYDGPRGTDPDGVPLERVFVFLQNHDQIGNRAFGDRLHQAVEMSTYRALCSLLLFAPETPLLFMGQEWAAGSPFLFFTDHHEELGRAVSKGRRREFANFRSFSDPETQAQIPDPQDPNSFLRSKLDWTELKTESAQKILAFHARLIEFRKTLPRPVQFTAQALSDRALILIRSSRPNWQALFVQLTAAGSHTIPRHSLPQGEWEKVLSSEDPSFCGDPTPVEIVETSQRVRVNFNRPGSILVTGIVG